VEHSQNGKQLIQHELALGVGVQTPPRDAYESRLVSSVGIMLGPDADSPFDFAQGKLLLTHSLSS
jgi:hypothetical protein